VEFYNLDAIIAVGQRLNRAVAATHKEFLSIRPGGNPGEGPVVKESFTTDCEPNPQSQESSAPMIRAVSVTEESSATLEESSTVRPEAGRLATTEECSAVPGQSPTPCPTRNPNP
jgi:hypothetical protein